MRGRGEVGARKGPPKSEISLHHDMQGFGMKGNSVEVSWMDGNQAEMHHTGEQVKPKEERWGGDRPAPKMWTQTRILRHIRVLATPSPDMQLHICITDETRGLVDVGGCVGWVRDGVGARARTTSVCTHSQSKRDLGVPKHRWGTSSRI